MSDCTSLFKDQEVVDTTHKMSSKLFFIENNSQTTDLCQNYTKCSEDNTVIVKNEWYSNNLRYKKIMKE